MKKSIKKLVGAVLALALSIALVPAQTAKADEVNDLTMTDAQLEYAYYGEWGDTTDQYWFTISRESFVADAIFDDANDKTINWNYEGTVIRENVAMNFDEWEASTFGDAVPTGKAKALYFTDADYNYYVRKEYHGAGGANVTVEFEDKATGTITWYYTLSMKFAGEESFFVDGALANALEMVSGEAAEEPKTEEGKTDAAQEETKPVASGREVLEGESVYIVKKGDCLWNIAKLLLGDGNKYKDLFTRNGDIVEEADLIFPGQEIIIPAK